jgi:hypothetical protein
MSHVRMRVRRGWIIRGARNSTSTRRRRSTSSIGSTRIGSIA